MRSSLRPLALLVLFGATAGTLLDALHTFGGITRYTTPLVLSTAWWVPVLFANAYGVGGFVYAMGWRGLRGPERVASWPACALGVAGFAALYAASAFLPAENAGKLAVLGAGAAALWLALDRTLVGVLLALVAAFFGPLTEVLLVRAGAFAHLQPDFLGIPMWLPALYLASGPSFGQFARRVVGTGERAREGIDPTPRLPALADRPVP